LKVLEKSLNFTEVVFENFFFIGFRSSNQAFSRMNLEFRVQSISFLKQIVHKLLEKLPLKLTKAMTAFNPRRMASLDKRGSNKILLKTLLQILIDKNRFQESEADNVTQQYLKYIDEVVAEQQSRFTSFTL
jgi:hypothetical protein